MERTERPAATAAAKGGGSREHDPLQRVRLPPQTDKDRPAELRGPELQPVQDPSCGPRGRHLGGGQGARLPVALLRLHGGRRLRHHRMGRLPEGEPQTPETGLAPRAVQDRAGETEQSA